MLHDEDDVVGDAEQSQSHFGHVKLVVGSVETAKHNLHKREEPTSEVEEDVDDGPAVGGLPHTVPVDLGEVLEDRDHHLGVAQPAHEAPFWRWLDDLNLSENEVQGQ